MPPETTAILLAEKLLALTYALGDAARRSDSTELRALFTERTKALALLERTPASPELLDILRKVQIAEVETQGRFHQSKSEAVRDMEKGLHGKRVPSAYAVRSGQRAIDFSG